ncbi:transmembrane protein 233 [Lingula anatina]|uniref:Transmembrane protein 233 n=1 Tax=Lingula anatina TaxID=7574 RepID=A0A1S3JB26_LINAN|nr:transmembrane protein 233 [Lingula anatina]|eukprot:XP_013407602.1 transmembrane protein 233 [Lingula anatina]
MENPNAPPTYDTQPGYVGVGGTQQTMVMTAPAGGTVIINQAAESRPSSYLGFSIFVMLCCNLLFGIIALIFSVMSSSAADDNDFASARTKGKVALGLNITGMLVTVLIVVVVVALVVSNPLLLLMG